MTTDPVIQSTIENKVMQILLDDSGAGNRLTYRAMISIRDLILTAETNPDVRAIVISGGGSDFSLGQSAQLVDEEWPTEYSKIRQRARMALPHLFSKIC